MSNKTKSRSSFLQYAIGKNLYDMSIAVRRWRAGAKAKVISNGISFPYLEAGNRDNETIVILHGFSDSKDSFLSVAKILMTKYHVIMPDMPGFGDSQKQPHAKYSLEQYACWLFDFLRELKIDRPHIIGHSLGGATATTMALQNAQALRSLSIINGGGVIPKEPVGIYEQWERGKNIFAISSPNDFQDLLDINFHRQPYIPPAVKYYIYKRYRRNRDWYTKIMHDLTGGGIGKKNNEEIIHELSLNHKIENINIPTFIVWGQEDKVFPPSIGELYHNGIPNSKLYIMPEAGHCLNLERPGKFCKVYLQFIESL